MSPWRSRNKRRYPCSDIVSNRHRGYLFERQRPAASIGRLALSTIGPGVYTSGRRGVAWQRLAIERRASGTCCTIETADVAPVTDLVAPQRKRRNSLFHLHVVTASGSGIDTRRPAFIPRSPIKKRDKKCVRVVR